MEKDPFVNVKTLGFCASEDVAHSVAREMAIALRSAFSNVCLTCSVSSLCLSGYFQNLEGHLIPCVRGVWRDKVCLEWAVHGAHTMYSADSRYFSMYIPPGCPRLVVVKIPMSYTTGVEVKEGRALVVGETGNRGVYRAIAIFKKE